MIMHLNFVLCTTNSKEYKVSSEKYFNKIIRLNKNIEIKTMIEDYNVIQDWHSDLN